MKGTGNSDGSIPVDFELLEELTRRAEELRLGAVRGLTTEEAYGFSIEPIEQPSDATNH